MIKNATHVLVNRASVRKNICNMLVLIIDIRESPDFNETGNTTFNHLFNAT